MVFIKCVISLTVHYKVTKIHKPFFSSDNETAKEHQSDNKQDPISKYKNLLQEIQQKEDKKKHKDMEMEITWGIGVKDKAEELVKKKVQGKLYFINHAFIFRSLLIF